MINIKTNMLRLALAALVLSTANVAMATDKYTNYEGLGVWKSIASQPVLKVFIEESSIKAELINNDNQNANEQNKNKQLPAIRLKSVNNMLFKEYAKDYINLNDFDHDGWVDVGILKSVSYGGGKRCYAVYPYKPEVYSFSARAKKTICIN